MTPGPPGYAALLRGRDFTLLFAGQAVSRLGDGIHEVALLWLVLRLTGSALITGTVLAVQLLPTLFFGLLAGALVDRWDRRRTMIIADVARAGLVLLIPLLNSLGALTLPALYVISFLLAVFGQVFRPALMASLPNLIAPDALLPANALMGMTRQLGGIAGPALGGVLVSVTGLNSVFYIDAATFAVSGYAIFLAGVSSGTRAKVALTARAVTTEIGEGLRYMGRQRAVLTLAILGILSHAYWAAIPVVAPVFADRVLGGGSATYGGLLSAMNLGMVAGGLIIGTAARGRHRGWLVVAGYAGMALGVTALGFARTPAQAIGVIALSGMLSMLSVVPFFALLQDIVPDEFRGRVLSTDETLEHGILPLFYALAGYFADALGAQMTFWIVGGIMGGVALAGVSLPPVRRAR